MQNDVVIYPHSKSTVKWTMAINDFMKEAWMGDITVKQACILSAKKMNAIIAEE